jgi:hypothetical protein
MEPVADDLERQSVADALVSNHRSLIESECRELVLAAQWADLHPMSSGTVLPGTERAKRYGGEGTPFAGEFAAAELGVLLGRSHVAAATLIADALDVRHRLPMLWAALTAGRVRVWQARHVAARTRATGLTLAQAREVDAATTPYLASLPWGRLQDLLEARIIASDPEAAEARRVAAELDRFVITGQSTEHGLKTLVAKATAGEVIYLVAMVDRIAEILLRHGDTDPIGPRRSKALGILAHPARALALLQEGRVEDQVVSTGSTTRDVPLPPATLYVHVSRESMATGEGVARMEGVGPITIGQASEFLHHSHVTIKPVIDLDQDLPVDCYEVPDRLRELMHLRSPASASHGPRPPDTAWTSTTPSRGSRPARPPGTARRLGSATSASSPASSTAPKPMRWAGGTDNPSPASTTGGHPRATSSPSTTPAPTGSTRDTRSRRTSAPSLSSSRRPAAGDS